MANNPLPDAALAELDRLHAAATPGEWRPEVPAWNKHRRNCKTAISSPTGTVLNTITPKVPRDGVIGYRPPGECKIAQYISALHNAYPALRQRILDAESRLAEVERERDAAEALVAGLRGALEETRKDKEELDGTDAAHPEWWRGNDTGVAQVCAQINAILDGADVFGTAAEPWESTRRRVAEARQDSERMRWILCNCELVHAGTLRNGKPVYLESLEELDAARGTK